MLEFLVLSGEFPGFSNEHEEMQVDFFYKFAPFFKFLRLNQD